MELPHLSRRTSVNNSAWQRRSGTLNSVAKPYFYYPHIPINSIRCGQTFSNSRKHAYQRMEENEADDRGSYMEIVSFPLV